MAKQIIILVSVLVVLAGAGVGVALYFTNKEKSNRAEEARLNAERGLAALKDKDYKQAVDCLGVAIKYNPNDTALLHSRGLAYYGLENYDDAIADYNSAIRQKPNDPELFTHRGEAYLALKNYDNALLDFNHALEHDADYVTALRGRGNAYLGKKNYAKATEAYDEALQREKDHVPTVTALARARFLLNDQQTALKLAVNAAQLNPDLTDVYTYYFNGLQGPLQLLDPLLQIDYHFPDGHMYADAFYLRGLIDLRLSDYKKAIADLDVRIHFAEKDAEAYYHRGDAYLQLNEKGKAEADFDRAIKYNSKHALARIARGKLYFQAKKYKEAAADFTVALNVRPSEDLFFRRGEAYFLNSEYSNAVGDFSSVIEANEKSAAAYNYRSQANLRLHHTDKALADANEALALDPKNIEYLYNRASVYIRRGTEFRTEDDFDKAVKDLDVALEIDPKNIRAINTRGALHMGQRKYDQAVVDYNGAIDVNPKDAPSWNHRGEAYYQLGEWDNALADYRKAIELDPDYVEALNNCAWLMATCKDNAFYTRLHNEALPLAEKAVKLDDQKTARYMSTLAAASAARLNFPEARKWEEKAEDVHLPNRYTEVELNRSKTRLATYGRDEPWKEFEDAYDQ
jgi:tetratricopeptide (TPR) repeat protein